MIDTALPAAIYAAGVLGEDTGKMASGVLRYGSYPLVCVIDPIHIGKTVHDVLPTWMPDDRRSIPVLPSVKSALELGAKTLILGIANAGGKLPESALKDIDFAVECGMNVINGLHDHLSDRYKVLQPGQTVWDVRTEPKGIPIWSGKSSQLSARRMLMVGTDMGVGKMTAGLELYRKAKHRMKASFVATGQIGITITGAGIPLDAIRLDYAAAAVEAEVVRYADSDLIIIEGQGSLLHPGSSATLPLLRGAAPTELVMCHRAGMHRLRRAPNVIVPDLRCICSLYEELAGVCGALTPAKVTGICLNTQDLSETEARNAIQELSDHCSLPCDDPIRFASDEFFDAVLGFDATTHEQ